MADEKKQLSPAYLAYTTFKNSVRGLKHGSTIPDRIDNSVFGSMSGSAKNQLFGAMKFFNLLDAKSAASPRLRQLVLSDENAWNKIMGEMIQEFYPDQVKLLKTGTPQTLRESFGDIGGIATPAVRFLLAACKDTGIEVAPLIQKGSKGTSPARKRKQRLDEDGGSGGNSTPPAPPSGPPADSMAMALLAKFPAFDPTWGAEQQKAWFSAYEKLLGMSVAKGGAP